MCTKAFATVRNIVCMISGTTLAMLQGPFALVYVNHARVR